MRGLRPCRHFGIAAVEPAREPRSVGPPSGMLQAYTFLATAMARHMGCSSSAAWDPSSSNLPTAAEPSIPNA